MLGSIARNIDSMTGALATAAASSSLPPASAAAAAASAPSTSAVEAAVANARSEIDRLDELVEMASSNNNTHNQQTSAPHDHRADTPAAGAGAGIGSSGSSHHVPPRPRPPQSYSSASASPRPLHDQVHPMTHPVPAAAAPAHSVGGSSGHSGSGPAVPTPTSAGGVSGTSSGGNTSPFLMPRNPRDTVLTSGSPKRRIAAVHASQQQAHHIGSRGQQHHITAATSLTGAELRGSAASGGGAHAMRRPYATSGASSLGGLGSSGRHGAGANGGPPRVVGSIGNGIGSGTSMVPPPPPPPPPFQPASARSTPTNASSNYRTHQPKPESHTTHSHSHIILPPSMHAQSRNPSDPDAEEQAMFESRLCEDEYGVAVRKINHNGKSQLRYVKCVWLPSSEMVLDALGVSNGVDGGGGIDGINGVSGGGIISPSESYSRGGSPTKKKSSAAGNAASTTASMNSVTTGGNGGHGSGNRRGRGRARSNTASGGNSVSSLMGRMVSAGRSRGRSLSRDPSVRMNGRNGGGAPSSSASHLSQNGGGGGGAINGSNNGPPKVVVEGPISSPGIAFHDDERDKDGARLLQTRQDSLPLGLGGGGDVDPATMSTKQMRALTWGNKKKVRIPLNRFVCVRKGKTTDRTKRNGHSASRLLSLITDDPANPSLDIEAPTKLDRDKFAKAFARFLEVPLAAEEGSKGSGSGRQRRSAAAATVANGRVGKFCRKSFSLFFTFLAFFVLELKLFSHIHGPLSFMIPPPQIPKAFEAKKCRRNSFPLLFRRPISIPRRLCCRARLLNRLSPNPTGVSIRQLQLRLCYHRSRLWRVAMRMVGLALLQAPEWMHRRPQNREVLASVDTSVMLERPLQHLAGLRLLVPGSQCRLRMLELCIQWRGRPMRSYLMPP